MKDARRSSVPRTLAALTSAGCMLLGCARGDLPSVHFTTEGDAHEVGQCVYRLAQQSLSYGEQVNIVDLSKPPEVQVTKTYRGTVTLWEIDLLPTTSRSLSVHVLYYP